MAKTDLPPVPPLLADAALIDGPTCAAACGMSLSSWHELVRRKQAPQPAIRQPRYTRWRLADVRQFLLDLTKTAADDTELVTERARRASAASVSKRRSAEATA